jgi:hypothetical protein
MSRSEARLLILVNASAAACSFVGSLIIADWIAWTLGDPEPKERNSFRETMFTWISGSRS